MITGFLPKRVEWNSREVLGNLTRADISLSEKEATELQGMLWNDLCSEYDAQNFSAHLRNLDLSYSEEFLMFERAWLGDEWNHYLGFRFLYSTLYGLPEKQITHELGKRIADFDAIAEFLEQEFAICMVIAYDEIATTKSYSMDHKLYRSFGDPRLLRWIRMVTRDEAFHFHNCMEVVRIRHQSRLAEIGNHAARLVEWDLNSREYLGTFVLDHQGHYFTPDFLEKCAKVMKNYF